MKQDKFKVLGGVVTFNPDTSRFTENLRTLVNQVDELYVFDNGSKNLGDIEKILNQFSTNVVLHNERKNAGIAYALKKIMEYANKRDFNWVLSVDQDSVLDSKLVDEYKKNILNYKNDDIGMLTCLIKDRNFEDKSVEKQKERLKEVPICITSAAFTNVKNYFSTEGYDSNLFIDLVDTDICLTLRENGFKIFRINYLGIYHEIGHGENKQILLKKIIVHHSSIFREYYMSRNSIILRKKHPKLYTRKVMVNGLCLKFLTIIFFEKNKNKRLIKYLKGLIDGIKTYD